ncbi:hypothetical protein BDD43_1748 [Mucilaginibacter gracilis]|uniref:Tetratricopeptide repeat protein n=1 Tax=Mucilaginibacter gracilis TaxID=423350 RepID=A0A495J0I0_9SPHI|nr:hypothetical protein [Mucilaginibacter gracilis]RKR81599.1 hypothetical protein BDD43_1748 [Mucilaginibacter gracilis]
MEDLTTTNNAVAEAKSGCVNCGNPQIVEGYANALCKPCRDGFNKLSIPLWVKLFGAFVLLLFVVAIFEIPTNFSTALSLAKAEKAEKEGKYLTSQRELEKIIDKAPDAIEIPGHLLIAAFYNLDYKTLGQMARKLTGKTFEDTALVHQINYLESKANNYFPTDSFMVVAKPYNAKFDAIPESVYKQYIDKNPADLFARYNYAAKFFDTDKKKCDSLTDRILAIDPEYIFALQLKTSVKREIKQLDSSLYYCDKMVAINHELPLALSTKARTILKQGKKAEGLKMAKSSYGLNYKDGYTIATLALAYHLNGNTTERDALIAKTDRDSSDLGYMQYTKDVISGKVTF